MLGIPLGYYLGYTLNMKALGFWIGLASSLFIISISLFIYLLSVLKKKHTW